MTRLPLYNMASLNGFHLMRLRLLREESTVPRSPSRLYYVRVYKVLCRIYFLA
jgi:hypothetical protein